MKALKFICILAMLSLLAGCSVRTELYIQNLLEEDVELKVVYNGTLQKLLERENYKIDFADTILQPKKYRKLKYLKEIEQRQINDSTLIIGIPKNSTVRVASTFNFRYESMIDHLEFIGYKNDINPAGYSGKKLTIEELISASKRERFDYVYSLKE